MVVPGDWQAEIDSQVPLMALEQTVGRLEEVRFPAQEGAEPNRANRDVRRDHQAPP